MVSQHGKASYEEFGVEIATRHRIEPMLKSEVFRRMGTEMIKAESLMNEVLRGDGVTCQVRTPESGRN